MFRFTIRDLLWLMVVVGMSCGWWVTASSLNATRQHAEHLRLSLLAAKSENHAAMEAIKTGVYVHFGRGVDWEVIDQPIP